MTTEQTKQTEPQSIYVPVFVRPGPGGERMGVSLFLTHDKAKAFGLRVKKDLKSKFSRVARFEEVPS